MPWSWGVGTVSLYVACLASLCVFRCTVAHPPLDATSMKAFSQSEFRATYELMVQYKHGRNVQTCPKVIEFKAIPRKQNEDLLISHTDMSIAEEKGAELLDCTDEGQMRLVKSENLVGDRLELFKDSIADDVDTNIVYDDLASKLEGKRYYVSVSDSQRECGSGNVWFGENETFIFFDESRLTPLNVVKKISNGTPTLFSLPLIGDIRYMIAVRSGTTCIYRVDVDVESILNDTPRASDSPSPTPSPSGTPLLSVSFPVPASSSARPSASATSSVSPSTSAAPIPSASPSASTTPLPSAFPSDSTTPTPSETMAPIPTSSTSSSASAVVSVSASPSASSSALPSASSTSNISVSPSLSAEPTREPTIVVPQRPSTSPQTSSVSTSPPQSSVTSSQSADPAPPSAMPSAAPSESATPSRTVEASRPAAPLQSSNASPSAMSSQLPSAAPSQATIPLQSAAASQGVLPSQGALPSQATPPSQPASVSQPILPSQAAPSSQAAPPTQAATSSQSATGSQSAAAPQSATPTRSAAMSPLTIILQSAAPTSTESSSLASLAPSPSASETASAIQRSTSPSSSQAPLSSSFSPQAGTAVPSPSTSADSALISQSVAVSPSPAASSAGNGVRPTVTPKPSLTPSRSATPSPGGGSADGGNSLSGGDRNSTDNVDGTSTCFPANARVQLESGAEVSVTELSVGDRVLSGIGEYSEILLFTHADSGARAWFVALGTESGRSLSVTPGHYIYVNGMLKQARDVSIGDALQVVDPAKGTWTSRLDKVVSVEKVVDSGLFNPHTASGDIFVNGVLSSCYTETVEPLAAHAFLAPIRGLANFKVRGASSALASGVSKVAASVTG